MQIPMLNCLAGWGEEEDHIKQQQNHRNIFQAP